MEKAASRHIRGGEGQELGRRDQGRHRAFAILYPDYVEAGSVYEFLADAYLAKGDKAKAMAELERYSKIGGRESVRR